MRQGQKEALFDPHQLLRQPLQIHLQIHYIGPAPQTDQPYLLLVINLQHFETKSSVIKVLS